MEITLREIAQLIGGEVRGDPGATVSSLAGIEEAGPGDISFIANPRYARHLQTTRATAVICSPDLQAEGKNLIVVDNPYLAYAKTVGCFNPAPPEPGTVDERAFVGERVRLGNNVSVYPFAYIEAGCSIGDNAVIYPHCFVGRGVTIGDDTIIHPGVTIRHGCRIGSRVIVNAGAVIGSEGFGFAKDGDAYYKIPQLGIVQIDDDVEIGAGATIDRAAIDRTWIKRGTKTDNLVHIAHNVTVGEDTVLVAQVGISGSTSLGNRVTMAGQSATTGHLTIGDDVVIGARGAAVSDIPAGQVVSGAPHMPHKTWLRTMSTLPRLPEMRKTLIALEKKIGDLEQLVEKMSRSSKTDD